MRARELIFSSVAKLPLNCLSGRFEKYPEDNAFELYGVPGPDPYGQDFPDFDYTST
jgi:protein kinase A